MEYLYSLVRNDNVLCSLNDIKTAQEGLEYFGGSTYIRYNELGLSNYDLENLLEEDHNGNN